ncbi:MAG: NAD-binding protein, partial [Candidatus Odinarchaeota archaeon]
MSAKKKFGHVSWLEEPATKQQDQKKLSIRTRISKYEWFYLAGLGLITLVLGFIGFSKLAAEQNLYHSPSTIFYKVLRLFILEGEFTTPIPLELEIARFLAPAFLAYAGLKALLLVFQENIQVFRVHFFKNHAVICGLGDKGFYLAQDFINSGTNVVIIEKNPVNDHLQLIKQDGAVVLIGDATEKVLLQKAKVHRANSLIVVSGDDGVNVEIAVRAYNLINSFKPDSIVKHGKVNCYVHLVDLHLRTTLSRHAIFTNPHDLFVLNYFNSFENAARLLFREYPIEKMTSIDPSSEQIHLVIIGLGRMGQSVLIQSSKVCYYSATTKPCITVVDKEAEMKVNSFKRFNPHFTKVVDLHYETLDVLSPKLAYASFWNDENTPPVTLFIICIDDDALGLTTALTLLNSLGNEKKPILVRMEDYTGLATLLYEQNFVKNNPIYPFGMTRDIVSREILLNESLDTLAKIITSEGEIEQITTYIPADLKAVKDSWSYLPENMKESTRHQADHLEIKLRNIDCVVDQVENRAVKIYELSPNEVEKLAQLEHARWLAEHQLDGWTYTRVEENSHLKISPYLVPWQKLPEAKKESIRQTVRKIPRLLAGYGLEIQKLVPYHRPANLPPVVEHIDLFKGSKNVLLSLNYSITTKKFTLPRPITEDLNPDEWIKDYRECFLQLAGDPSIEEWIKERLTVLINGPQSLQNFCLADALIMVPPLERIINPLFESLSLYGKAGNFEPKGSGKSLLLLYLAHKWTIKYESPVLNVEHPHLLTKEDWKRLETRLIGLAEIYGFEKRLLLI